MAYTKEALLLDIHALVERYLEQELTAHLDDTDNVEIEVESDSEGDDIDMKSGDIWDLETQTIVGRKNLQTKEKIWFATEAADDDDGGEEVVAASLSPSPDADEAETGKQKSKKTAPKK